MTQFNLKFQKSNQQLPLSADNPAEVVILDSEGNGFKIGSLNVDKVFPSEKERMEGLKVLGAMISHISEKVEI